MLKDLKIDAAPTNHSPTEGKGSPMIVTNGDDVSELTTSADVENKETMEGKAVTPQNELNLNRDLKVALFGCELINQAGIMLQVTQVVIATAQVLYHRFYRKKKRTHKDFPPFHVGMACVYLATKVEEEKRRHRDILNVFDRLQKKRAGKPLNVLDPYGKRYSKWKNFMMKLELIILCDLGYMMKVDHPHKFILNYINVLEAGEKVAQKAWSYLNDSLRIPKVVEIKPEVMACSAIFLAARHLQVKLPDNPAWYSLFNATRKEIETVSRMIMELYKIPKIHFEKLEDESNPDDEIQRLKKMTLPTAPQKKSKSDARGDKKDKKKKRKKEKKDSSRERSDSDEDGGRKKDRRRSRSRRRHKKKKRRQRSHSRSESDRRSRSSRRSSRRKRHKRRYSASQSAGTSRSRSRSRTPRRRREKRRRRA